MGCGETSAEEKLLLAKLEKLEIQVMKEKELDKLAKIEGKDIKSSNKLKLDRDNLNNSEGMIQSPINKSQKKIIKKKEIKKKINGKKVKIETSIINENNKSSRSNGKIIQSDNIKRKKKKKSKKENINIYIKLYNFIK